MNNYEIVGLICGGIPFALLVLAMVIIYGHAFFVWVRDFKLQEKVENSKREWRRFWVDPFQIGMCLFTMIIMVGAVSMVMAVSVRDQKRNKEMTSLYIPGDKIVTKKLRIVPHSMMPSEIHDKMAENMSDSACWPEPTGRGCFIPYEVGTATPEGMTEIMKMIESWLLSEGIKDGETVLLEWDW